MLKELGRWTQIDELQRLDLEQALSKFSVVGQNIKVDSFQLISKNCQVNLWGTVESAQRLDLNGRLTVSQFLSQKIPNELEENFAKSKDGESRYLDFQVTGSVLKPQTDLIERIIGDKGKVVEKALSARTAKRSDTIGFQLIPSKSEHHRTVDLVAFHAGGSCLQQSVRTAFAAGSNRPSGRFRSPPLMRVIAGSAGGIRLKIPAHDLRPTMDMVREAAFSALADLVAGSRVLDLIRRFRSLRHRSFKPRGGGSRFRG